MLLGVPGVFVMRPAHCKFTTIWQYYGGITATVYSIPLLGFLPFLHHKNPASLLLQHPQPICVADRPADCFDPPQGRIGGIFFKAVTRERREITHTLQNGRYLYKAIVIACQVGSGA
ncbi:MAG: hypothetical protein P1V21_11360 [Rhizobiaceae bacterium]|nr:hypothetical protein [Rhizobiaceae bacterium]